VVDWANIWLDPVSGSAGANPSVCGHIGIDLFLGDGYVPCHNSSDSAYAACEMSSVGTISYAYVHSFSDFPYGIFVTNISANVCKGQPWCLSRVPTINHLWGNRITGAALEFYPHTSCASDAKYDATSNTYGGARVQIGASPSAGCVPLGAPSPYNAFSYFANGGVYSCRVGTVTLPCSGAACTYAKLTGTVYELTSTVASGRVSIDMFQNGAGSYTDQEIGVSGFASTGSGTTGTYTSGPLYTGGNWKIYVGDHCGEAGRPACSTGGNHGSIIIDGVSIPSNSTTLDFHLDQHCFGYAQCSCERGSCP
jgi:hypothetical protein